MASQAALEFARRNGKCKSGKGTLTKALNKFSELCNDVTKMEPNIPELSRVRKANLLTEQVDKVRKAMAGLERRGWSRMTLALKEASWITSSKNKKKRNSPKERLLSPW